MTCNDCGSSVNSALVAGSCTPAWRIISMTLGQALEWTWEKLADHARLGLIITIIVIVIVITAIVVIVGIVVNSSTSSSSKSSTSTNSINSSNSSYSSNSSSNNGSSHGGSVPCLVPRQV